MMCLAKEGLKKISKLDGNKQLIKPLMTSINHVKEWHERVQSMILVTETKSTSFTFELSVRHDDWRVNNLISQVHLNYVIC